MRVLQSTPLYSYFTRRQSAINIMCLQVKTYATGKFQIKYRNQPPASNSTKTRNILLKLQAAVLVTCGTDMQHHTYSFFTRRARSTHMNSNHTDISYSPYLRKTQITFPFRPLTSNWATQIVYNPGDCGGEGGFSFLTE